jgi:ribulose-phosphate 3-epimerase
MGVPNILANPPRLPLVAPSVLSADFANIERDCRGVLAAGADLLHLDVMDGHFVPNLTMGPDMCRGLRRALPEVYLDAHLMVANPGMFIEPFAKAGANHFSFHVEVVEAGQIASMIDRIRSLGMQAGLVINPPTPVERILPFVHLADMVLVMSVNPGFSGQSFIASALEKTRAIRAKLRPEQRLQMDGGVTPATAAACREAGCDVMVTGSALFSAGAGERAGVIAALRGQ